MAQMKLWCSCHVKELGVANVDLYTLSWKQILALLDGKARCKHCGEILEGQR